MKQFNLTVIIVIAILMSSIVISCNGIKSGDKLSEKEIEYIKELGLLDSNENIILFETHSGRLFNSYQTSGNFISDKRLAAYWIEEDNPQRTSIDYAYYNNIDTLILTNLSHDWTLASYLTVKINNGQEFKLFVSGNNSEINDFFELSINEWEKNKK